MSSKIRSLQACLTAASVLAACVANAEIDDRIEAPYGDFRGQDSATVDGVVEFLGIPYAEPPVGENRWQPPTPITDAGRVQADAYGAQCQQAAAPGTMTFLPSALLGQFGPAGRGGPGWESGGSSGPVGGFGGLQNQSSEDCLFLNVWSGANTADAGRPVMVWIGGDQFERGSASDPNFAGAQLASRGIVVVNFNYRLGTFGFLAHPALTAEQGTSGNYGMMDAIAALEWVRSNIAAFGGDPDNITVFSGSAGAEMTAALIGSPEATGLFGKAVLQSGSWMGIGMSEMPTLADAEQAGLIGLAQQGELSLDELRDLPAGSVMGALADASLVVDGRYIPEDLSAVFASGNQNGVDVIVGSNREEGVTFVQRTNVRTAADYEEAVRERFGAMADDYLRIYPSGTDEIAMGSKVTALGDEMAWQMRLTANRQTEAGNRAFVYEFTRVPPPTGGADEPSATHGAETNYVFNNMGQFRQWTDGDRQLAQIMASYWINFAETGSPNGPHRWQDADLPIWPQYTGSEEFQVMEFGDRIGTNPIWQVTPEKLDLFNELYTSVIPGAN